MLTTDESRYNLSQLLFYILWNCTAPHCIVLHGTKVLRLANSDLKWLLAVYRPTGQENIQHFAVFLTVHQQRCEPEEAYPYRLHSGAVSCRLALVLSWIVLHPNTTLAADDKMGQKRARSLFDWRLDQCSLTFSVIDVSQAPDQSVFSFGHSI